jgi:CubicO group peptidase (beta-lactamase class C family)
MLGKPLAILFFCLPVSGMFASAAPQKVTEPQARNPLKVVPSGRKQGDQIAVPVAIDIHKVDPRRLLMKGYRQSFVQQPASFYYSHNIARLDVARDSVRKGSKPYHLKEPIGSLDLTYEYKNKRHSLDEYFTRSAVTSFLVLDADQIVHERYFHGANRNSLFLQHSVSKSLLGIAIGIAVQDGKVRSIEDPVDRYLPELAKSGFRGVSIENLARMSSGVKWNEIYTDPRSDMHRYINALLRGSTSFMQLAASVRPQKKQGGEFNYQSINSQVLGELLQRTYKKRLNKVIEETIWSKIGAQSDAFYFRGRKQSGVAAAGSLNATTRDLGRFGLMVMNGGVLGGQRIVSKSWIDQISRPTIAFAKPQPNGPEVDTTHVGYNSQWWLLDGPDRAIMAMGIYGQAVYVNPKKRVVIVQTSAWREPDQEDDWNEMIKAMETIAQHLHPTR